MTPADRQRIIDALHAARMQPYLAAAKGSQKDAMRLYQWNSKLTASVQAVLGVTEVVLRNAMDRELQLWNNGRTGGTQSWLLNKPAPPLASLAGSKRSNAVDLAQKAVSSRPGTQPRAGAPVTHDDVLAQVMFGLWVELLPNHGPKAAAPAHHQENANRLTLWNDALHQAFPNVVDPDGRITYLRVAHLYKMRNRVAHMEPLIGLNVGQCITDAIDVLGSIDPAVRSWVAGGLASEVTVVLKQRP